MIPITQKETGPVISDQSRLGPTHYWRIRKWLPERYGHPCRLLATGKKGNVLVEFGDGVRHIVSRYSIRKLSTQKEMAGISADHSKTHNAASSPGRLQLPKGGKSQ